ncbi:MAG: hypothetical protein GY838_05175 [bacterium]|nr:hypothetical protein [bacterium]
MTDRSPILTWHPRRAVFLLLGAGAFAVTEFGRHVLRPLVREHGVDDLGITDSIGNGGGILVQIFLAFAVINPDRRRSFILATVFAAGYIIYEFLQPHLPKGVFDWKDVWGTIIGYVIALPVLALVWRCDKRS